MEAPILSSLESLTDIGLHGGVDMRPTLLRVLTDLYVQKLSHTPEEENQYSEVALRLLDTVDVTARAAVAARLAQHLAPPARVVARLAADLPDVAAALRPPSPSPLPASPAPLPADRTPRFNRGVLGPTAEPVGPEVASELNEVFFAASANERRLILLNLPVAASLPGRHLRAASDATIGRRLEAAALARRREDFAQHLAGALHISRQQAERIARDELGEPIVVAAKALGVPRDLLYRILLFVNTAVGHSVERVHALAELYDEISVQVAEDLVAIWQALDPAERRQTSAAHQPLLANDDESGLRTAQPAQRRLTTPDQARRRDAS